MRRRDLFAAGAAAALPRFAVAQPARVLKFVPQANLTSLDPIWTTANVTRNHAYMVYDTLYGMDASFKPQPQMAAGHTVSDDQLTWTITLRPGLKFHDGEPVLARDVVASFIMPERIARTDPFQQIRETVGSGPFRFKPDEYNSGSLAVYERFAGYVPTTHGTPSLTAGPKHANFDRVEWHIIPDAATASAALQSGEIDWYEQPPPELQVLLKRGRTIMVEPIDSLNNPAILRFNHLLPPFNDKKMRQALLPAINQEDYMTAIVGPDPALFTQLGLFTPGTPFANDAGMAPLNGPRSIARAKQLMQEAGYTNQLIRLIGPTDILAPAAMTQVCGGMFRELGVNLDFVLTDWGSVIQRRASKEPLDKGGWSVLLTAFASFEFADPATNFPLRGNGPGAWFGWPTVPRLEELRDAWFDAADPARQQALARDLQTVLLDELPYIPVGSYKSMTALRRNLSGRVPGFALFWNLKRA